MFSKKKSASKKDKDVPASKSGKEKSSKNDKKKDVIKENKKSSSSSKDKKDKRGSGEGSNDGGFNWVPTDSKHIHDKDGKGSKTDKKSTSSSSNALGQGQHGHKYSAKNLNLVPKSSIYDARKSVAKTSSEKQHKSNGILKPQGNGAVPVTSDVAPQYRVPPTQVTFAGPDNKVHQSIVNVTNSLLRKPINTNGNHPINMNGSTINGHHTNMANLKPSVVQSLFPSQNHNIKTNPTTTQPAPREINSEEVNHYFISHGQDTKHVTSINVNTKTSVQLEGNNSNVSGSSSHYGHINAVARQPVSREGSFSKTVFPSNDHEDGKCVTCGSLKDSSSHNHIVHNTIKQQQHNNAQPVVLAEVNIPNNFIAPPNSSNHNTVKKDGEIQYAELTFQRKNNIPRSLSQNSLNNIDNGTKESNKIKGILKHNRPPGKRVEFNNDLDVKFFNTLSTLSRHESLESLSIFDEDAYGRDYFMMCDKYSQPQPLDDTDLYMYTLRKNRCSPSKYPARGTVSYRQPQQPAPWAAYPWLAYDGCKGSLRQKQPTVRTIRMLNPPIGDHRSYGKYVW